MNDARKTKAQLIAELRALRAELAAKPAAQRDPNPETDSPDGRYVGVLESARALLVETDAEDRFTYVSPTITEVLGYRPEELLQRPGREWLAEHKPPGSRSVLRRMLEPGGASNALIRLRHRNGRWIYLATSIHRYRADGDELRTVAMARDVTEVVEAREERDRSEARYRTLAENASDLILEMDESGNPLFIGPNSESLLGLPPEAILKGEIDLNERIHPADRVRTDEAFFQTGVEGESRRVEYRFRHADGTWRWLETTMRSYRTDLGELRRVAVARDVTQRVEAERELEESQERYRVLTEATGDLITESDAEARLLYVSPSCRQIAGYDPADLQGTTPFLLVHPDDVERRMEDDFEGARDAKPCVTKPYRVLHRNGAWHWMETTRTSYHRADGEPIILRVTRDVTERIQSEERNRRLQERMQQAQKLEGLGVMAGGIAHDFNNLLTPILGDTSLALLDLPPDSPARARLTRVQKAVHRAAALTNQMLTYAGEASLHVELVNLSRLVEEIGQLLQTAASRHAKLVYQLGRKLPMIEADAARLSQVVMNLITNASEAVGDRGGEIELRTGRVQLAERELAGLYLGSGLPGGDYVFVEVTDSGAGMDEKTRARIFDPFFSTKFTGRGLGLAAVLGIVRAHQGAIDLESEVGRGTRFRVLFPASHGVFSRRPVGRRRIEDWRAAGTVLVVDDEAGVRDVAADTLERAGLRVLRAASGREGVELFRAHAADIRAVLLDRTMPDSNGEDVLKAMRRIRPDAVILLISGFTEEQASGPPMGRELDGFIKKPFLPGALLEKVRDAIEP